MRIVVELKRDEQPKVVINQLFKQSQMLQSYGLIMLGDPRGAAEQMNMQEADRGYLTTAATW